MRHTRKLGSAAAVGLCLTIPALPASAQAARPQPQLVSRTTASVAAIELTGIVHDRTGRPLVGAVVSAMGSESAFAVSDQDGRFTFRTLPPGPYVVRAHLQGYLPARPRLMQISTSARTDFAIILVKRSEAADTPAVIAAGVGPAEEPIAEPEPEGTHEHDELAWRLRHLKRSVLKSEGEGVPGLDTTWPADSRLAGLGRAMGESARLASSILADLPLDGQLNLLKVEDNVLAGTLLLSQLVRATGRADLALAGYYQGLGSVHARGMLPQTHAYIRNVTVLRARFRRG